MAESFVIVTDSTSDLNKELREKYDIEYVAMNYLVDDTEYPASLDWESHSTKDFYDLMRNGKLVKTTMVPATTFTAFFDKCYAEGRKNILYIACSSGLSGSYNMSLKLIEEFCTSHEDMTIIAVDSKISSLGEGFLAMKASEMRAEGKSMKEIADYLESIKLNINQFATVATLNYLVKSGRMKPMKGFFGDLVGIKPILISDATGTNVAVKKVKGAHASLMEIVNLTVTSAIKPEEQTLYISHADNLESATFLRDEIMKRAPFKDAVISTIAPIVGASTGPGTLCTFCLGPEVGVVNE